jgi:quercetin dioxygenase-like cupin family protein
MLFEVEGRMYDLNPLDNISLPAGLAHRAVNIDMREPAVCHVAMRTTTPDRELVETFFSKKRMGFKTMTQPTGERITRIADAKRYSPGDNASFVDYFNEALIPGYGLSGGYGLFTTGGRLPAHLHDFDESICIVQGSATCIVEGRTHQMAEPATALQPRGRIHYFINKSPDPMAMIWVYAGPMPERIIVEDDCADVPGVAWGEACAASSR